MGVQENTLVGREGDCVHINSFHQQVIQNLDKACAQLANLMLVVLSQHYIDFVKGTKIFSNYVDLCLHSAQWTMSSMHSPVLIMFIHFVAPMVAHMRIEVLSLLARWTQNL